MESVGVKTSYFIRVMGLYSLAPVRVTSSVCLRGVAAFSPLANSPPAISPPANGPPAKSPPPAAIRPPLAYNSM